MSTRYYSQQYSALDDPFASTSNIGLDEYADQEIDKAPQPTYQQQPKFTRPARSWSRKRKFVIWGAVAGAIIVAAAVAIGVAIPLAHKTPFNYVVSNAQVTNQSAFDSGGATHDSPTNTKDGIGAGKDAYTYYTGPAESFPAADTWISFEDMWKANLKTLQTSCGILNEGKDNTDKVIQQIYDAIQDRATASLVDHRFIFAIILQESHGCVRVGESTSQSGVTNPGLMQSHDGHKYVSDHSSESIMAMVQDGTQGTDAGDGLVQNLNLYGNPYSAARGYNSGQIAEDGNLSDGAGATACYVSDVANRLQGWVFAETKCTEES